MSAPRIAPIDPPYTAEVQAAFDVIMRGAAPLKLFRTVARNPRVLQRMMAGGLLDKGSITLRQRELMILRTTARCGAEYEWGVHVAAFAPKAGLAEAEWRATASGADPGSWSAEDRLVLRLADALYEPKTASCCASPMRSMRRTPSTTACGPSYAPRSRKPSSSN